MLSGYFRAQTGEVTWTTATRPVWSDRHQLTAWMGVDICSEDNSYVTPAEFEATATVSQHSPSIRGDHPNKRVVTKPRGTSFDE